MHYSNPLSRMAVLVWLFVMGTAMAHAASREQCERDFSPRSGQAGKDVIWVPTPDELVTAMLKAAMTTAEDYVIDLGSGDGRIPIAAAKQFGARALGIEYNPQMAKLARCYVKAEGLEDKVEIRQADIFQTDFRQATVLTLYLLSGLNLKLRPMILKMKPGTRVVSNSFDMGEWPADEVIEVPASYTRGYLWIVPAHVNGAWTFREQGGSDLFRLTLDQHFQQIKGFAPEGSRGPTVRDARLRGAQIEFTVVGHGEQPMRLKGSVEEGRILASTRRGGRIARYVGTRS